MYQTYSNVYVLMKDTHFVVEKTNSKYKNVMRGQGSDCRSSANIAQHVLLIIKPIICIQVEMLQFFFFGGGGGGGSSRYPGCMV